MNNMASTESEIMNFAQRLAGTGTVVGVGQRDIMALSAAMSSVGINAESGGSAMSKVLTKMNNAVQDGGEKLEGFAKVAGVSGKEFADTWKKDPYAAVQQFEKGLAAQNKQGHNVKSMLKELGITELRETDTVLRLANGNKQLQTARENANKGYKEGNALSKEAETKYKTLGNQMKLFMNHVRELGISIGEAVAPAIVLMMKALTPLIDALAKSPKIIRLTVAALAAMVAIIGPITFGLSLFVGSLHMASLGLTSFTASASKGGLAAKLFGMSVTTATNPLGKFKAGLMGIPGLFWKSSKASKGASTAMAASGATTAKSAGKFSKFGSIVKTIINPLKWASGGLSVFMKVAKVAGLGLRILTGPIGLAITGLTLLASWLIKSYKNVKWFRDGVNGAIEVVKVFAKGIGGGLISSMKELGKWMGSLGNKAKDFGKAWHESWKDTEVGKARIKEWNALRDTTKKVFDTMAQGTKKATDTSNALGKGVSKGTRQALQKYVGFSEGSIRAIEKIKINGGKLNKETQKELSDSIKNGGKEAIAAVKDRNKKIESNLRKALENSTSISEEEKQNIINKTQEASDKKVEKLEKLNKEISELEKKQYTDGKLTAEESKLLKSKLEERNKMTVKYVAKGAEEQQAILSRMDVNAAGLSNQEIGKALKESAKAEKKAIKEAAKIRNEGVKEADRALADGSINKGQHRSIVLDLESDYNAAVDTANKKTKEVQKSVEKGNKGIWKEMNKQGETYTGAQKMWNGFKSGWNNFFNAENINGLLTSFGALIAKPFRALGRMVGNWWNQGVSETKVSWSALTNKLGTAWSSVSGWFVQRGQVMGSSIKTGWNSFFSTAGGWWTTLIRVLGLAWASTRQWFVQRGLAIGGAIKNGWNTSLATVGSWWTKLIGGLSSGWSTVKQWFYNRGVAIGQTMAKAWASTKSLTYNVWTSIWGTVKGAWDKIWTKTSGTTTLIWTKIKSSWDWVRNKTIGTYGSVRDYVSGVWNKIWSKTSSITNLIWGKVKGIWDAVRNKTVGIYGTIRDFMVKVWNRIWSKISSTTTLIWGKIKSSWDWVRNKTVSTYGTIRDFIFKVWNRIWSKTSSITTSIWNKIKSSWDWIRNKTVATYKTIRDYIFGVWNRIWSKTASITTSIWNKVSSSWTAVKNKTVSIYSYVRDFLARTWNSIWNKIKSITNAIWSKISSTWNNVRSKTSSIFSSIWNTIKNIWNAIWNFLRNTVQKIRNKIVDVWSNMKNNMRTMTNSIRNHTVGRFESMYNGAKGWIDKIGGYIDGAKNWMANKASSMGKAVANKAIDGLNLMIDGINKISKGITGSKLIDPIGSIGGGSGTIGKQLSTGTRKGRPSANSKGQLRQPTLATVNDKGRGNGKGRNGHQELIVRQGRHIEVPQGRDVVTALGKGDAVISGSETQALQAQGVIPHFAKGSGGKKKGLLDEALGAAGGALGGFGANLSNTAHQTKDKTENAINGVSQAIEAGVKEGGAALGHGMGNVMEWIEKPKQLVETMMKKIGVDFGNVPGGTGELVSGAYSKLMPKLIDKVKEMFSDVEDGGDGDASWLLKHPQLQPFGKYVGMTMNGTDNHYGLDFGMPTGTSVKAVTAGTITNAGWSPYGGGNQVELKEPGGKWFQWWMHNSKISVKKGQKVQPGDELAKSGNTGSSSTPHVHIQRMKGRVGNDTAVDPTNWLKSLKGGGSKNKKASAWRDDITRAAAQMSAKVSNSDINNIISLINAESGGNAGVTQSASLLDVNTLFGNPAQGLLQYIPQTFRNYAVKGHTNIKSGFDQLLAFFNNKHWKTQFNPNGGWSPSGPRRFARGGIIEKDQLVRAGEGNRKEMIIPLTRKTRAMELIDQAKSMMGVGPEGSVSLGGGGNLNDEKLDKLISAIGNLTKIVEDKKLVVDGEAISDYTNDNLGKKMNKYGYMSGQPNY